MSKALPFTAAGLARAIRGAEAAGKRVVGIRPDGTLLLGDKDAAGGPIELGEPAPPMQADPFVVAAERVGRAETKRKRDRAAS